MPGPFDPAVRRALAPARREVGTVVVAGVIGSCLLIAQAFVIARLIIVAIGSGDGPVWPWALATVALLAARAGVTAVSDLAAARAAGRVGAAVRRRVMGHLLTADPGRSGAAAAVATRGATAVEPYLTRYVPTLVLAGVLPPLVLLAIAVTDPASALVVVVTLPLIPVFGILIGLATRDEATSQWRAMADLAGHFLDVMRGLPTLVAFNRAEAQSSVIAAVTERYRERLMRTLRIAFVSSAALELIATLSVAVVAVTVGLRLAGGSIPLSVALPVLLLAPEAYWPLRKVGVEFHAAAEGVAVFEELAELEADVPAGTEAVAPELGSGAIPVVDLQHVGLTWPGRTVPALGPTSLHLEGPGLAALVGPSGAGKSTLLAILAGEVTPTTGSLTVIERERIAWLPQRPVFLAASVATNLRLAAPSASDADLGAVLARVGLAERLPDLDLIVDEDGLALSAGERARLALARVLLARRPLVLLDEPTAHLDAATEQLIADVVTDLARTARVVVVAHRPTLLARADVVVEVVPPLAESRVLGHRVPGYGAPSSTTTRVSTHQNPGLEPPEPGIRRWAWVLDGLAVASGVALTATAGWLIVRAAAEPEFLTLLVAIVAVRTFGIARPVLRYAERLVSHDEALRLLGRSRVQVYDALVPLVPGRLGRARGDVLAAVVDDVDVALDRVLRVRTPVRGYALMAVLVTGVIAYLDLPTGLVVGVLTAAGALVFGLARRGATRTESAAVTVRARISVEVTEAVQTAAERRRWQSADDVLDRLDALGEEATVAARASARASTGARTLALLLAGLAIATIALTADAPDAVLALLILTPLALADPIGSLADAGVAAARVAAAQSRLDALLDATPAVTQVDHPTPITSPHLTIDHPAVDRGGRMLLGDVVAQLPPGGILAVRGANGTGKSTLAALLLRFLDPDHGSVRLGATDLQDAAVVDVRTTVGLVDDDPHVFASTVAENIRFARPGASDSEIERALADAQLADWVADLPDGLDTRLGDGYAEVSGGERARLGIARSLLAEHEVLVLDEPTAHLDTATADRLRDEVCGPGRPATRSVVWIAHDTYPDADVTIELAPPAGATA